MYIRTYGTYVHTNCKAVTMNTTNGTMHTYSRYDSIPMVPSLGNPCWVGVDERHEQGKLSVDGFL